ncbi:uncharacterized protein LOC133191378 [Saccostrea echinata]|uniref:uncharacterized protein LOC133191378 n=1 Tax=Saccostrea echinata TaxID=191078 RepID=UPI002A83A0FE|nr:uncharacterized protein LOC133191378 [Saccostrea echinata]
MSASLLLQILCFQLVLVVVSSECDRTKGPPGLTGCIHSPLYSKHQAAVCLPKKTITSITKHVTCREENTEFCWYLCTSEPSYGGLSACQCDPIYHFAEKNSILDKKCYFPTKDCSWYSTCLRKKNNCQSISEAEKECIRLEKASKKLSLLGQSWADSVKLCIQRNLIYILYPQVLSECEKMESMIHWLTTTCYYKELHSKYRYCDLSFPDRFKLDALSSITSLVSCNYENFVPHWAKLLIFYVNNNTEKDKDTLAIEIGEALAKSFSWEESGLSYESVAPETVNKGKSITIRIHLYSKTKDNTKTNNAIEHLKNYVENGKMAILILKDNTIVDVKHVISCMTIGCHLQYFSYQTTSDSPCIEKGGWCQQKPFSCDHCEGTKQCCLPHEECTNIEIIKRKDWGASEPQRITYLKDKNTPVKYFIIHHTDTDTCNNIESCSAILQGIQKDHIENPEKIYYDIGYSFLVGGDGKIYEGQSWSREGAHTLGKNHVGLAVSFIGNFSKKKPKTIAIQAVKNLIQCGVDKGYIKPDYELLGHRDQDPTNECPGEMLYKEIQKWDKFSGKKA